MLQINLWNERKQTYNRTTDKQKIPKKKQQLRATTKLCTWVQSLDVPTISLRYPFPHLWDVAMYIYMESIPGTLMIRMCSQTQNFRKRVRLQRRTWVTYAMRRCTRRIFHCPLQQMFWNTNLEGSTFGAWEKCFTLYSKVWEAVAQNTASLLLVFHSQPQIESLKQE